MSVLDWTILSVTIVVVAAIARCVGKYTRSVSDFLAAGRTAKRYLLTVTSGAAGHAAVRIIGSFEATYRAGFAIHWWGLLTTPVSTLINMTGFVVYRFRETRALTLAQFLEVRYSKRLRICVGILMFVSGVLNMGIFPAVGARFFIYFCGLPEVIVVGGVNVSMLAVIMCALVGISLYLTFGGQVTILLTDFFEGIYTNIAFIVVLVFLFWRFDWSAIAQALTSVPKGQSMINPFETGKVEDFNVWYYIIHLFTAVYGTMAWQGNQGSNAAPASPHEARMGKVLGSWREMAFSLMLLLLPIAAFTVLHHSSFSTMASVAQERLADIDNTQVRTQMTVPVTLSVLLPVGIKGLLCAIMFCGFIGNMDTYLHSWGSIFIQDVILPFRKKPFEPATHLRLLRWSIIGVAAFIILFSLLYRPNEFILMFFIGTGAIYYTGAGAIIIGGLYWRKGTTAGAWAAVVTGATIMVVSLIARQMPPELLPRWLSRLPNSQIVSVIAMASALIAYVVVSLARPYVFNLEQMLHRGQYALGAEEIMAPKRVAFWRRLARIGPECTRADVGLCFGTLAWSVLWCLLAIGGSTWYAFHHIDDAVWMRFWELKAWIGLILGTVVTIWIAIGGLRDLRYMLQQLRTGQRDAQDDGMVLRHRNHDEVMNSSTERQREAVGSESEIR